MQNSRYKIGLLLKPKHNVAEPTAEYTAVELTDVHKASSIIYKVSCLNM